MKIQEKILNSLNNNKLNPKEWFKKWNNYILEIQNLTQFRNYLDWFIINVFDLEKTFLERINIETKPIIEFWWVHNKKFLVM
jgi:hypothetical protein